MATNNASVRSTSAIRRFTNCFNGRLIYAITLIALSQINFGFDQGVFTNTQAMTPFERKFGIWNSTRDTWVIEPYFLSLLNSLNYIGFAFGIVTGSTISARFGRRAVMFAMCGWALVGAILLVTAQHREQILAGRVVAYVYIGMELAVVPVYQSELVPSRVRGFVVGSYQSGLLIGSLLASVICRGTSTIDDDNAWRVPMGLLFIIPTIVGCGAFYLPESPRWLLSKGRDVDALASLTVLRQGRYSQEEIRHELLEIQDTIEALAVKGRWIELFQGTNLKRTLIVVGVNIFLQITGSNFSAVYGAVFYKSLGTVNPFSMSAAGSAINIFMVLIAQLCADTVGRKPLMFVGVLVQTIGLFCVGGLGTMADQSVAVRNGIVAAFVLFGAGFALGWAPLSHAIAAEVPTLRLRDKVSFKSEIKLIKGCC